MKQKSIIVGVLLFLVGGLIGYSVAQRSQGTGPLADLQGVPSSADYETNISLSDEDTQHWEELLRSGNTKQFLSEYNALVNTANKEALRAGQPPIPRLIGNPVCTDLQDQYHIYYSEYEYWNAVYQYLNSLPNPTPQQQAAALQALRNAFTYLQLAHGAQTYGTSLGCKIRANIGS